MKIVIDTREQSPLTFMKSSVVEGSVRKTLKTGDYSIEGMEHLIAIERKSPMDLFQTMGRGNKRFQRELARTINFDYFAILVECSYMDVIKKNFPNSHRTKMRGNVVMDILFTLKFKYGIDVIFAHDRSEATAIIRQTFKTYLANKEKIVLTKIGDVPCNMIKIILHQRRKLKKVLACRSKEAKTTKRLKSKKA